MLGLGFCLLNSIWSFTKYNMYSHQPEGKGLLSPFYHILAKESTVVFLRHSTKLQQVLMECCIFLWESVSHPTSCKGLVPCWPKIVGIMDASKYSVGVVVIGKGLEIPPTVSWLDGPAGIQGDMVSKGNLQGSITNLDLEMAALLLIFLAIKEVTQTAKVDLTRLHIVLFSNNSLSVYWVQCLAVQRSVVATQLIWALALWPQLTHVSPLLLLHVAGSHNATTDILSWSFGNTQHWYCHSDDEFLTMYNSLFPLLTQESWNGSSSPPYCVWKIFPSCGQRILQWKGDGVYQELEHSVGRLGPMLHTCGIGPLPTEGPGWAQSPNSLKILSLCPKAIMAEDNRLQIRQYLCHSQLFIRWSPWPQGDTP